MSAEGLYNAMCRYLIENGWRRQEEGSGWWWKAGADEFLTGEAVETQLEMDGLDTRVMRAWEPYEFWASDAKEA